MSLKIPFKDIMTHTKIYFIEQSTFPAYNARRKTLSLKAERLLKRIVKISFCHKMAKILSRCTIKYFLLRAICAFNMRLLIVRNNPLGLVRATS